MFYFFAPILFSVSLKIPRLTKDQGLPTFTVHEMSVANYLSKGRRRGNKLRQHGMQEEFSLFSDRFYLAANTTQGPHPLQKISTAGQIGSLNFREQRISQKRLRSHVTRSLHKSGGNR